MSLNIGRKGFIGVGLESTPGAPVAVDDYIPFTENTLQGKHEPIPNEAAYGIREKTFDAVDGKKWSEGVIGINADYTNIGYFLIAALGSNSPSNVAGSVYDHTITRNNSNTPQTMTLTQDRAVDQQYYRNLAVKTFEMSVADGLVDAKSTLLGKFPITTTSGSNTTASGGIYTFADAHFAFGANVAGAVSASNLKPHDFKLTIENNTTAQFRHGDNEPDSIDHGEFEASAEGTLYFENTTQRDRYYNNTKAAAAFVLTGPGIGGGYFGTLTFNMYRTHLNSNELETGLADFYAEKFEIMCDYDNANSKSIDAVLRNLKSSY